MQTLLKDPLFHPVTNAKKAYNKSHIETRVSIEQAFGLLKQKFRYLRIPLGTRLNNCLVIIVVIFCLHNFGLHRNEASLSLEDFNIAQELDSENFTSSSLQGRAVRQRLILQYFGN